MDNLFVSKKKQQQNIKILIIFFAVLIIFFIIRNIGKSIKNFFQDSPDKVNITYFNQNKVQLDIPNLSLCGQKISIDKNDFFDFKERFEKEAYITINVAYQFIIGLKRTTLYFPFIEKKLKEFGLPDDIKYLAMAESYLRNDALSDAGAVGIWQFMPGTAKDYGLIINDFVDERLNFEKSTISALKYLQDLNKKFDGDRFLTMAGYNMGGNGLQKIIDNQENKNYFSLILNNETARYIFRILAIKYAFENKEKLGFEIGKNEYYYFPEIKTIQISEIKDISKFAKDNNTSLYNFTMLNPWVKNKLNTLPKRDDNQNREIKLIK